MFKPTNRWLLVLLLAALLLSACRPVTRPPDQAAASAEVFPNRELAEQFASLWVQPDKALLDTIVSPDLVYENVDVADIHNKASLGWKIRDVRAFAPDFHETLLDAFGEGDWYVGRSRFDATVADSPVSYGGLNLVHVVDGRIAEVWSVSDEVAVSRIFNEMRNDEKRMQFLWGDDSTIAGVGGTPQANKQLAAAWLQGDAAAQANLAHDQFIFHSTQYPGKHTYEERAAIMQELKSGFPDLQVKVDSPIIAGGDKVGFHFTMSGTNSGSFMGSASNGRTYTWPGIAIYRIADGKIAEEWFLLSAYTIFKMVELQPKRS